MSRASLESHPRASAPAQLAYTYRRHAHVHPTVLSPWFKSRHKKRRVVQPDLVRTIARHLQPGGWLFVQTDVLDLAEDARETIREISGDTLVDYHDNVEDWTAPKPSELAAVGTERERSCAELGRPVYRALFSKSKSSEFESLSGA